MFSTSVTTNSQIGYISYLFYFYQLELEHNKIVKLQKCCQTGFTLYHKLDSHDFRTQKKSIHCIHDIVYT